jgi:diguanylate cyclase (GGDEF)-like protein
MRRALHRLSDAGRLSVLIAVLAAATVWIAFVHVSLAQWEPRWYLPVHTAMEVLAVVVAMLVFSTGAQPVDGRMPAAVAVLSTASLAVGVIDFGHLLSVPGMPGLVGPGTAATGIDFWLAARAVGACSLLAAAFTPPDRTIAHDVHRAGVAAALGVAALVYWLVLAHRDLLPETFVPGRGITGFKIGCEYALVVLNMVAALRYLVRAHGALRRDRYLAAAAAIMALGGVPFTLYRTPHDLLNSAGHLYQVIACQFLYRAIFVEAVQAPYAQLRRSERSLAESEGKFRSLMECAPDGIVLSDAAGRVAMVNARAEELFGMGRELIAGRALDQLWSRTDGNDCVECPRAPGGTFPAEVRRAVLPTGQQIAIVRDLSERRRLERALVDQLTHDALTGLPNRQRILETLDEAIGVARREGRTLAVLVFDVDEFKKINGRFGWTSGDDVLRECMARLSPLLAARDMLARQGGNEFVVVQADSGEATATRLAQHLLACMDAPFTLQGQLLALTASIGIALLPPRECGAQQLLQMAQVAMAASRADGPGGYRFHTAAMEAAIHERIDFEAMLRHAVAHGQLALQFQPRFSLLDGSMVGMEALVRWRHPMLGLVAPERFIPLAEETGIIEEIDAWVLEAACRHAAAWLLEGLPLGRMSVNLSARQFQHGGLAQRVRATRARAGLPARHLELEITEGTVMHDTEESTAVLRSLQGLGVALSIDDFGTGYSSLSYLKRLPIDILKIDRSFVQDVVADSGGAAIIRAIIALGHSLNLVVVAEGVETPHQLAFLKDNGCDEIQGYHFSRPVWPAELRNLLLAGNANHAPDAGAPREPGLPLG